MIYDLHSHSTASDGTLTPTELVQRAVELGVGMLALTDHDTVAGVAEARAAAAGQPLQFIAGVEISVMWEDKPFHLAALNIDETHPALQQLLAEQARLRHIRAEQIGEKLAKVGIPNAYAGAKQLAGGEVTRAHYARFLVQQGIVRNDEQAFRRYLASGKPAYSKPLWCSLEQAIEVTHQAGGLICVAHPLRYKLTARWIRRLIEAFKQAGGDGLEVAGCNQTPDQRQLLTRWAAEFDLLASAGSDFHYPTGWTELGKDLQLPAACRPIWQVWEK